MTDLPRLAVTQEQAADLLTDEPLSRLMDGTVTLRLPERPTWTCATCQGVGSSPPDHVGNCPDCDGHGSMPIPEGARVQVGWWEQVEDGHGYATDVWHPVATATLAEVARAYKSTIKDGMQTWIVTLTDVEATDG